LVIMNASPKNRPVNTESRIQNLPRDSCMMAVKRVEIRRAGIVPTLAS